MIKKVKLIQVRLRLNTHSHRYMPKIALIRVCMYVCQLFNHKFSLKEDMITEDFTLARKKQTISFLAESFFLFCFVHMYHRIDERFVLLCQSERKTNIFGCP